MKKMSRPFLFGALALVLLIAACTGQEGSPTAVGTTIPGDETASPPPLTTDTAGAETASPEVTVDLTATFDTATVPAGTDTTQISGTPLAAPELVLLECQYCIDGMAHALLVLPETVTFETVADTATLSTPGPGMGCNTVDTFGGRQTVICRSQENTSLNLNICTDPNNCTQLLVELQSCPDTTQPGLIDTPEAGVPTDTPRDTTATSTPIAGVTDTPAVISPTPTP